MSGIIPSSIDLSDCSSPNHINLITEVSSPHKITFETEENNISNLTTCPEA